MFCKDIVVEVRYKIGTRVRIEFTPAIDGLGQNIFKSNQKYHFLEPISSARLLFSEPITMEYFVYICRLVPR